MNRSTINLHTKIKEFLFGSPTATDWVILATFTRTFSIMTKILHMIHCVLFGVLLWWWEKFLQMLPIFTTTVKTYLFNRLPVSVTNHKIILPHDPEDCKNNFHCCELQISSHMLRYYKNVCCKICYNSLVHLIYLTIEQFTAITHTFTLSSLSLLQRLLAL